MWVNGQKVDFVTISCELLTALDQTVCSVIVIIEQENSFPIRGSNSRRPVTCQPVWPLHVMVFCDMTISMMMKFKYSDFIHVGRGTRVYLRWHHNTTQNRIGGIGFKILILTIVIVQFNFLYTRSCKKEELERECAEER